MELKNKAMLSKVTVKTWGGSKSDSMATAETLARKKAQRGAGSFTKKLIESWMIGEYTSAANAAQETHKRFTLPWMDGGYRALPSELFFEYTQQMRKHIDAANAGIEKFLSDRYDLMLETAQQRLGEMYNEEDFPTREQLRSKFGIDVTFLPMPDVDDWRINLSEDQEAELREEVAATIKAQQVDAVRDAWSRIVTVVEHLHETLADKDRRFHNATFDKLRDLSELLPKLNVFDDPELNAYAQKLSDSLCKYEPDAIRQSTDKRTEIADEAKRILDKIKNKA